MTTVMVDGTTVDVPAIYRRWPGYPVAGYSTGSPDIKWTTAQFALFAQKIRIAQSFDLATDEVTIARCLDVENFAATPSDWPPFYDSRADKQTATVYCSLLTVPQVVAASAAAGIGLPQRWWLAWYPQFPMRRTVDVVLNHLKALTNVELDPATVWAWQYGAFGEWDLSAVFGTPDFSRR